MTQPDDVNGAWLRDEMLRRLEPPVVDARRPSAQIVQFVHQTIALIKDDNPAVLAPDFRAGALQQELPIGPAGAQGKEGT